MGGVLFAANAEHIITVPVNGAVFARIHAFTEAETRAGVFGISATRSTSLFFSRSTAAIFV